MLLTKQATKLEVAWRFKGFKNSNVKIEVQLEIHIEHNKSEKKHLIQARYI
jgi:hypothetical protein